MRLFNVVILFCFSVFSHAAEVIDLELDSGDTISINAYSAKSKVLFLFLPSDRGLSSENYKSMQKLSTKGVSAWGVDLHDSFMIPKYRGSVNRFNSDYLTEIIDLAQKQGFEELYLVSSGRGVKLTLEMAYNWQSKNPKSNILKGHLMHSPHLIKGRPLPGDNANYIDISNYSNLPIYIMLPQFGTKYFRGEEISLQLNKGGSLVFVHRLKGVRGGFHRRKLEDLNLESRKARQKLVDMYLQASKLIKNTKTPSILSKMEVIESSAQKNTSEEVLERYIGEQNIALKLPSYSGEVLNLEDYKGQVVLLNFWASWCKPCVKEVPSLMRLQSFYDQKDFKIITINIGESKKDITKFANKLKLNLPILMDEDGDSTKDWKVYVYPSNFLLNRDGEVVYAYRGALEWDSKEITNIIDKLL